MGKAPAPAGTIDAALRRCAVVLSLEPDALAGDGDAPFLDKVAEGSRTVPLLALASRVVRLPASAISPSRPEIVVFLDLLSKTFPGRKGPALGLALALAAVQAPKAEANLLAYEKQFGPDGRTALALGRIRLARGQHREALQDFRRARQAGVDDGQAAFGEGVALLELGDAVRAVEPLRLASMRSAQDGAIAFCLALALAKSGDAHGALAVLDGLVARDPSNAKAWFERGNLLQDAGLHSDAAASFEKALAAEPGWAAAAFNRALSLQALGRMEEALRWFGHAVSNDPASAGPVAQALTRERAGCLWLQPGQMIAELSARDIRARGAEAAAIDAGFGEQRLAEP
jgi:tetratricopeptide (TPR) repeat protein